MNGLLPPTTLSRDRSSAFAVAEQSCDTSLNESIPRGDADKRLRAYVYGVSGGGRGGQHPHRGLLPMTARWRRPGTSRCSDIMTSWSLSPHSFYAESLRRNNHIWAGKWLDRFSRRVQLASPPTEATRPRLAVFSLPGKRVSYQASGRNTDNLS